MWTESLSRLACPDPDMVKAGTRPAFWEVTKSFGDGSAAAPVARGVAAVALVGEAGIRLIVDDRRQVPMGRDRRVLPDIGALDRLRRDGALVVVGGGSRRQRRRRDDTRDREREE